MATTTTNFGWDIPQSTDLVKDGATAIATLGQDIDTALVDLKGGTTGQVLAKASNSDLDFTWATDASGIPATIFDAKGDLIAASAADTAARLAVGTNGQYLSADSTTATGLKWVTPATSTIAWTQVGTSSSTGASVTISSLGSYDQFMIVFDAVSSSSAAAELYLRFNSDTANNYKLFGINVDGAGVNTLSTSARSYVSMGIMGSTAGSIICGYALINGSKSTGTKMGTFMGGGNGTSPYGAMGGFSYSGSSAISSITYLFDSGNIDAGTVTVYGGNA